MARQDDIDKQGPFTLVIKRSFEPKPCPKPTHVLVGGGGLLGVVSLLAASPLAAFGKPAMI
jgi:hypothetical protein